MKLNIKFINKSSKPTLKAQKNFILDYIPLDSSIMFLDDDLMEVMTGYKDKET